MSGRAAPHAWERAVVGWHAAFWVVLGLTVLALLLDGVPTGSRAVVGAGAVLALAASYALLGGPAARSRSQPRAVGYVASLVVLLPLLMWVEEGTSFLLFLAYPQVWMLVDGRVRGVVGTAAVSLASLLGFVLAAGGDPDTLRAAGVAIAVSFLFSLTLGLWIGSVIEQSAERGELIAQLEATRDELAAAERAAGAAQVQARMARDIHDTLAQGFTSLVMLAQVARRELVAGDEAAVADRLDVVEDVARTNLAEARALVAAFSPVDVHGADLARALHRLAARFGDETGVAVTVDVDDAVARSLTPATAVVLLRSAQEGLANVRKHSRATSVTLRLHQRDGGADDDDGQGDRDQGDGGAVDGHGDAGAVGRSGAGRLLLEVTDDGVGPPATPNGRGLGLEGLRARAGEVGGRVGVGAAAGGGMRLAVEVPGTVRA